MCKYTFWEGTVAGLDEELVVNASNYAAAVCKVKQHIANKCKKRFFRKIYVKHFSYKC